jgi:SOS-response transcriptional repressor LexA
MEQKQLAALLGYTNNAITNWEAGRTRPDISVIPRLCEVLRIPVHELLGITGRDASTREERDLLAQYRDLSEGNRSVVRQMIGSLLQQQCTADFALLRSTYRPVPMAEAAAAAGVGAPMEGESAFHEVYVKANRLQEQCDFIVRVNGESMEPMYPDGSLVYVKKTQELQYGDIGLFVVNGESYIKLYRAEGLLSLNPAFPLIPVCEGSSCLAVGRVVGMVREDDLPTKEETGLIREACMAEA